MIKTTNYAHRILQPISPSLIQPQGIALIWFLYIVYTDPLAIKMKLMVNCHTNEFDYHILGILIYQKCNF